MIKAGHRRRREAHRLREARRPDQRRAVHHPRPDPQGRRQGRRQPPAPLRQALPEGEGDRRQRRAGPRPHRLWQRHRLDDPHALPPDRLHAAGSTTTRPARGPWPRPRAAPSSPTTIPRPITSAASCSSPTACAASTNAARARPTSPKSPSGGARTASARRAPKASPKCSPTAAGARSPRAAATRAAKAR